MGVGSNWPHAQVDPNRSEVLRARADAEVGRVGLLIHFSGRRALLRCFYPVARRPAALSVLTLKYATNFPRASFLD